MVLPTAKKLAGKRGGYIEYQRDLEPNECSRYELTPGGTEGCVLLGTDKEGKQVAFIPDYAY